MPEQTKSPTAIAIMTKKKVMLTASEKSSGNPPKCVQSEMIGLIGAIIHKRTPSAMQYAWRAFDLRYAAASLYDNVLVFGEIFYG